MTLELRVVERPAAGEAAGALVLLHGRGADEHDLFPLLDVLDPGRRLRGFCPRGPHALPPGGAHWYRLGGIPTPDPATFRPSFEALSRWLATLPRPLVLGGFSQGAAMSYALTLAGGASRPDMLLAFSGFIPEVPALAYELGGLDSFPAMIAHGSLDPVIDVEWSRSARERLEEAGAAVVYREPPVGHTIAPAVLDDARGLVAELLVG